MKLTRILPLALLALAAQPVFAQATAADTAAAGPSTGDLMNYVGYGFIVVTLLILLVVMLVLLNTLKVLTKALAGPQTAEQKAAELESKKQAKANRTLKLLSLKPLAEEHTLLMEHEFDGIQELDNPTPAWFMYLFYGTITFAVCYLLIYHVFGIGQLQYDEYKTEVKVATEQRAAYLAKSADMVDENTVKLTKDPAVLSAGEAVFKQNCVACHGDHAQGNIGPNLTDDYWLHGGKINNVFKTIKYGFKAMPTWEKQLSPKDIANVANYVKSLHGSNPAGAKAPQGDKETDDAAATTAASTKK